MTQTHTLERSQFIRRDCADVFAFFADATNLEKITPPALRFHIVTPRPIQMQAGTVIDYRLRLYGVGFSWRTTIELFEPPTRFVDTQTIGPYRSWRHMHEFHSVDGGTLMTDRVEYQMPLGLLGGVAQRLFVRRSLRNIFDYRQQQIEYLLPADR
ncbi:MAG: SRPBCC family protein [Planctomycetota bacterium]|nr:SRPBCC family protein [Planctomycetota bacterium]